MPTDTRSHCPYKGGLSIGRCAIGVSIYNDIAWSYRTPLPESQKIAGLVSFYSERVEVYVDGQLVQ